MWCGPCWRPCRRAGSRETMPKKPDTTKQTQQAHAPTPTRAGNSQDRVMDMDPALPDASALRAEMDERIRRYRYLMSLPLPTATCCPKARDDEAIVAQDVLDEYVVYDLYRHKVHALNPTAATVWQWCDGETPLADLTDRLGRQLALDRETAAPLLYLALGRLEQANLLEARVDRPPAYRRVRRRQMLQLVAASLLPVVTAMVAPAAAQSLSTGCPNVPSDCLTCASGVCCDCNSASDVFDLDHLYVCCGVAVGLCAFVDTVGICEEAGGIVCQQC